MIYDEILRNCFFALNLRIVFAAEYKSIFHDQSKKTWLLTPITLNLLGPFLFSFLHRSRKMGIIEL